MADPVGVMRRIASWLLPGGRLHVVVPNSASLHRLLGVEMGILSAPDDLSERDKAYGHRRVYGHEARRRVRAALGRG